MYFIVAFNIARGHSIERQDYITSIRAYQRDYPKPRITKVVAIGKTSESLQPKTQQLTHRQHLKNPHWYYGAYPDDNNGDDDECQNDYDEDDDDEYYKSTRGRNLRKSHDQSCDMSDCEDDEILEGYESYEAYFKLTWYDRRYRSRK